MHHWLETNQSLILRVKDPADAAPWSAFRAVYRPVVYRLARIRGLQDADADDLACSWLISATEARTPVPRVLRFAGVFV